MNVTEQIAHLKEQIVRVILDTDASLLAMERERDSAKAWATRMEDDNIRLSKKSRRRLQEVIDSEL